MFHVLFLSDSGSHPSVHLSLGSTRAGNQRQPQEPSTAPFNSHMSKTLSDVTDVTDHHGKYSDHSNQLSRFPAGPVLVKSQHGELDVKFDKTRNSPDVDFFLCDSPRLRLSSVEFGDIDLDCGDGASLTCEDDFLPDSSGGSSFDSTFHEPGASCTAGGHVPGVLSDRHTVSTSRLGEMPLKIADRFLPCVQPSTAPQAEQTHSLIIPKGKNITLEMQGQNVVETDCAIGSWPRQDVKRTAIGQSWVADGHGSVTAGDNLQGNLQPQNNTEPLQTCDKSFHCEAQARISPYNDNISSCDDTSPGVDPAEVTIANDDRSRGRYCLDHSDHFSSDLSHVNSSEPLQRDKSGLIQEAKSITCSNLTEIQCGGGQQEEGGGGAENAGCTVGGERMLLSDHHGNADRNNHRGEDAGGVIDGQKERMSGGDAGMHDGKQPLVNMNYIYSCNCKKKYPQI